MRRKSPIALVEWVKIFLSVKPVEESQRFEAFKSAAIQKAEELGVADEYKSLEEKNWKEKINQIRNTVSTKVRVVDGNLVGIYRKSGDNKLYTNKECTVELPQNAMAYSLPTITVSKKKSAENMEDLLAALKLSE